MKNKKLVGVIGCGPAGIIVTKELLSKGYNVVCFEKNDRVGGIYSTILPNSILTSSSLLTAFSDYSDRNENKPKFWSANEYIHYLEEYVNTFHLNSNIIFNTEVKTVRYNNENKKWFIYVENNITPYIVDSIAICSGANTNTYIPILPNQNSFKGQIIHSSEFKKSNVFINKRVLIIGSGETAADLSLQISIVAKKVGILIRGKHSHIVPRVQFSGYVSDTNTNRARYSNPYIIGSLIAYITQLLKIGLSYFQKDINTKKVVKKIAELNFKNGTSAFTRVGCNNEGYVKFGHV